jgi:hypothetical protein
MGGCKSETDQKHVSMQIRWPIGFFTPHRVSAWVHSPCRLIYLYSFFPPGKSKTCKLYKLQLQLMSPILCTCIKRMAQLLNSMKDFFVSKGQPRTQEFIRLQFLGRLVHLFPCDIISLTLTCDDSLRSGHSAAPDVGINDGDNLELGTGLERSKHSLAFLYSLLRFVKLVGSAWDDRFPSWRSGIAGFTILASIVLILNISALAWTATHLDDGHYATLAIGSYESISNLSGWLHFTTNILSTALLAGSNYCMQCLSSPTRAEVDAVHARGSYLNIGTLSWRNVLASRKRRIFLLVLLAISSIAMHPM